jgi:hypothetical protein
MYNSQLMGLARRSFSDYGDAVAKPTSCNRYALGMEPAFAGSALILRAVSQPSFKSTLKGGLRRSISG